MNPRRAIEGQTDRDEPSAIHSLHWDEPELEVPIAWAPGLGRVLAIWPAPIDQDACFAAAGFRDFADSNPRWDVEFTDLLRSLVHFLERTGRARATPKLFDALVAAARDDQFPPCVVQFGDPVQAIIRTSNGHPLFWVWTSGIGPERAQLLASVAGDRPVVNTRLDWNALT